MPHFFARSINKGIKFIFVIYFYIIFSFSIVETTIQISHGFFFQFLY